MRSGSECDPAGVAIGSDAVWVTNRADGTVSKIEPRTGAVIGTIGVGRSPTGVAASPEAVWVANAGDGTLSRVDPSTVTVVQSVPLGNPPRDVVWSPGGAYVTVGSSGAEHQGGKLRAVVGSSPASIDPALAYYAESWAVLAMTNDGLVAFRKVGGIQGTQLVPDLAVSLPLLTDGGRTYTFQVRPGIRYSDGRPVQPADFRRAIERLFELGSPGAPYYAGIVGADRCAKGKRCDLSRGIVADRAGSHGCVRAGSTRRRVPHETRALVCVRGTRGDAVPRPRDASHPGHRAVPGRRVRHEEPKIAPTSFATRTSASGPRTRSRRGFPTRSHFSWRLWGRRDRPARARAVERGRADVTMLGWGAPPPKDELERARRALPEQASPQHRVHHRVLLPQHARAAVRRRSRASRGLHSVRSGGLCRDRGSAVRADVPDPPAELSGLSADLPVRIRAVSRAVERARAAGRKRRRSRGSRHGVDVSPDAEQRAEYMASLLRSLGLPRATSRRSTRARPDRLLRDGQRLSEPGPDRLRRVGNPTIPSAAGFIPPLLSCSAFMPESPETNANLAAVLRPLRSTRR